MPRRNRTELLEQICQHLIEALGKGADDAQVRIELDRLGTQAEIAAAERNRLGLAAPQFGGWEAATLLALVVGSSSQSWT